MGSKHFIADSFMQNPQRYGTDSGDLNMVNDYFLRQGWQLLTREQFAAISTLTRERRKILEQNPNLDLRKKNKPSKFKQLTIFDFFNEGTAVQTKKITRYFKGDSERLNQSNSRIKKSVRKVDNQHIEAVRIMIQLLIANPTLKKIKWRRGKVPIYGCLSDILGGKMETKMGNSEQVAPYPLLKQ